MTTLPKSCEKNGRLYTRVFGVTARTKAGKYVSIAFCSDMEMAIKLFLAKCPRFTGNGVVYSEMAEDVGNGICISNCLTENIIMLFESTKELKTKVA